jgi:phospholipase C
MALEDVAHIVVLMLENRSFDCMLGKLYPKSAEFDGLSGTEANEDLDGTPVVVWNSGDTNKASITTGRLASRRCPTRRAPRKSPPPAPPR